MDTPPNANPNPGQAPNQGPTPGQIPNPAATPPPAGGQPSNTGMAILAYLGILIIIPFLTEAHKDPFVKFHIKQGLVLLIAEVIASIIAVVPIIGWVLSPIIWILAVIFLIMGIINAASGKMKELPIIGKYAQNFHF